MSVNRFTTARPRKVRVIASVALFAGVGLLATACSSSGGGDSENTLAVTMWGGKVQDTYIETTFTPWAEENGVTLKPDAPSDYAKLEAMVQAGKVDWGIVLVEAYFSESACEQGLLEKLPQRVLGAAEAAQVDPRLISECGLPYQLYSTNIGYNTEAFPDEHPTTWAEFFDTEKFPGKRGFWKFASGGVLEAALLADGVSPDDLYPLDVERALAKLDTIKDHIVWYETGDQQVNLLSTGEAPLVQVWNTRTRIAIDDGQPVADEFNENLLIHEQVVTPKGYPNTELAQDWMVWYLENPEAIANNVKATSIGPVSPLAFDFIDSSQVADLPGSEEFLAQSAGLMDPKYWAQNYQDVTERFNVWLAE